MFPAASCAMGNWQRILIGSDLHGPYLDRQAYRCFLAVASEYPWDRAILNGDTCDFTQLSSHAKKVGAFQRDFVDDVSLPEELHIIRGEIFAPLRKAIGKTPITMRLGNHETRWLSVAENNPTALAELVKSMRRCKSLYLEDALELDKYGIKLSYNAVDVLYRTFTVIHGVKTSPTAAKQNLLRYGSGTSGHTHRMNSWTQVMHGKNQGWFESGCLRTVKNIEYLPMGDRPDWSQGFLTLTINKESGDFFCTPHFIINGRVEFNGKILSA
jgi:hypothetical protein